MADATNLGSSFDAIIYSCIDGTPYVGTPTTNEEPKPLIVIPRESGITPPRFHFEQVYPNTSIPRYHITLDGRNTRGTKDGVFVGFNEEADVWDVDFNRAENAVLITRPDAQTISVATRVLSSYWSVNDDKIALPTSLPGQDFTKHDFFRLEDRTVE
ncbi:hypothetical protein V8B97DRAFT_1914713 [Scleroderma yunnanense]